MDDFLTLPMFLEDLPYSLSPPPPPHQGGPVESRHPGTSLVALASLFPYHIKHIVFFKFGGISSAVFFFFFFFF